MAFIKAPVVFTQVSEDDDIDGGDKWCPTPKAFTAFMKRDFDLCSNNVRIVLENASGPQSFRDLKECMLHSVDCVERVLAARIVSGSIREEAGRYSLQARK